MHNRRDLQAHLARDRRLVRKAQLRVQMAKVFARLAVLANLAWRRQPPILRADVDLVVRATLWDEEPPLARPLPA